MDFRHRVRRCRRDSRHHRLVGSCWEPTPTHLVVSIRRLRLNIKGPVPSCSCQSMIEGPYAPYITYYVSVSPILPRVHLSVLLASCSCHSLPPQFCIRFVLKRGRRPELLQNMLDLRKRLRGVPKGPKVSIVVTDIEDFSSESEYLYSLTAPICTLPCLFLAMTCLQFDASVLSLQLFAYIY